MKTIVFLGTNKSGSSRDAIKAAEEMGYYTCLLTNNIGQIQQRHDYQEVHMMQYCQLHRISQVVEMIRQLMRHSYEICAVVSFVDPWCGLASKVSELLGLKSYTTEAILKMQNKLETRKVLEGTPYNPRFFLLSPYLLNVVQDVETMFPVVVKYVDSNGSKDVYRCNSMKEYYENARKLARQYPGGTIVVEEYMDGPQYLVEAFAHEGTVILIAAIAQEISFINGHFIVTGYQLLTDTSTPFYQKLETAVKEIIAKFQLTSGPCHLEMRLVKEQWKLVEINPRISGAGMNQFLKAGLGYSYVEEILHAALQVPVNLTPRFVTPTYASYIVINETGILERVTGEKAASESNGVVATYVKPRKGNQLNPPSSMGDRYAYVIANGESEEEAKLHAMEASSKIKFKLKA